MGLVFKAKVMISVAAQGVCASYTLLFTNDEKCQFTLLSWEEFNFLCIASNKLKFIRDQQSSCDQSSAFFCY